MTRPPWSDGDSERARRLLCELGDAIRGTVMAARTSRSVESLSAVSHLSLADTIYQIDRVSEIALEGWFEQHWPAGWPVEVVMEGLEPEELWTFPRGTAIDQTILKCILDPIDGTRGLMYDKRSGWVLAALAPQLGAQTNLADIFVASMTELPTIKQWRADQVSAVRGRGLVAEGVDVIAGGRTSLHLQPSGATDFRHGFASLVQFFPEGNAHAAQLDEALWATLYGVPAPLIFHDQYISTGGQIYELLAGRDRMIGDLRPLTNRALNLESKLVCHPYDICTGFLLTEAGAILEGIDGEAIRAPLDTTSAIAWIGYANAALADQVRPVLGRLLRELAP